MRRLALMLTPALLTFHSVLASEMQDLFDMTLEELLQVEVTGVTSIDQSQLLTPASVSVWDEAAIARVGATNLSELLRYVPGMQLFRGDDLDMDSIIIRGRSTGSATREVLLLVNGQRIDNWVTNNPFLAIGRMNAQLIKKVEFIRGPASQLYGSNAFLGVINVVTKQQTNDFQINTGSHKRYELSGNLSWQNAQVNQQLNISLLDDKGESYRVKDRFSDGLTQFRDPMERYELHYKLDSHPVELDVFANTQRSTDYLSLGNAREGFNRKDTDYVSVNFGYQPSWFPKVESELETGFRYFSEERHNYYLGPGSLSTISNPASDAPLLGISDVLERAYWFKFNNIFSTEKAVYMLNAEWRKNDLARYTVQSNFDLKQFADGELPIHYYGELTANTPVNTPVYPRDVEQVSLEGQYVRTLAQNTEFTLGARFDDYSNIGSNVSFRAALVHTLAKHHAVKLIYGEAFRAPTAVELYLTNNANVEGNPDLKPEKVKTFELVWNSQWKDGGRLHASLYHNQFVDSISPQPTENRRRYQNSGKTESSGLELMTLFPISMSWALHVSGSYLFKLPQQSIRAARTEGNILLAYNREAFSATIDFDYTGNREYPSMLTGESMPINAFWLVNISSSYRLTEAGRLHLTAKNLSDKNSFSPTFNPSKQAMPNRGREVWLSYSYRY